MEAQAPNSEAIQKWCVDYVAKILDTPPDKVDPSVDIDRLGLDSSTAVALVMSLEDWLDIELMPELLFEYPSIKALSDHLATLAAEEDET